MGWLRTPSVNRIAEPLAISGRRYANVTVSRMASSFLHGLSSVC
jgi:hypothetical protein